MTTRAPSSFSAWSTVSEHHHPIELNESVSIGIAAHGNAEATQRCLEALFRSAAGDYELILVNDNSPDQGLTGQVYTWASNIHNNTHIYASTSQNIEYSGSVDLLLSHAQGDRVLFLSNDIYTTPYYLKALLDASLSAQDWGILRGSSNYVDNGLDSHNIPPGKTVESLEDIFTESRFISSLLTNLIIPDPFLTGDAFMVSRSLIRSIGTFDPLFYGYFADHDYGIRARVAGFQTLLVPGAYAFHQAGSNITYLDDEARTLKTDLRWARIDKNWSRFKLKYGIDAQTPFTGMHNIEWEKLCSESFAPEKHRFPPKNYTSLRVHPDASL